MKHLRTVAVFPFELLLMAHVLLLLTVAALCHVLGNVCQLIEGPQ